MNGLLEPKTPEEAKTTSLYVYGAAGVVAYMLLNRGSWLLAGAALFAANRIATGLQNPMRYAREKAPPQIVPVQIP